VNSIYTWNIILAFITFYLTVTALGIFVPKAHTNMHLAKRAENILFNEYELRKRKEGWMVKRIAGAIPRLESIINAGGLTGSSLRRMLQLMGHNASFERVIADQIIKSLIIAGMMLIVPILTGFTGYYLLSPLGFIVGMVIQNRSIYISYKKWQNELIKDLPLLIDKIQISLEAGKPVVHALRQVYRTASPRLANLLERLILDMQIMKQTEAIDRFARATGIPEMINFSAAVKIAIENGYNSSRNNFEILKQDIRKLRVISLNEITRNKPGSLRKLQLLMAHLLYRYFSPSFCRFSGRQLLL
jgi:Flp pilus assembly protein TadB